MFLIEIDLVLASRSNLTCFLGGGQNRLRFYFGPKTSWFNLWIEIDLGFVSGPEMTLFLVWGSTDLVFCAGGRD